MSGDDGDLFGAPPDGVADPGAGPPVDLWAEVVGQGAAVAELRAAVDRPVHAYLLLGPEGSGKRAAAVAFAADLLERAAGEDDAARARARRLVATGRHPCLTVVERTGPFITADQARALVAASALSPPEGELQVFVLADFHLVDRAGPMLLKAIEEPHPQTVFVVLAEELPADLVTIASRCVTVEFTAVPSAALRDRLVAEGVAPELAEVAAASAGGSLTRARLLGNDPGVAARRDAWWSVPDRLDGTGATATALVDGLLASIDEVAAPLAERQATEVAELDAVEEQLGERRAGVRRQLEERHKREQRRVRLDELRAGLSTLLARYRADVLDGADPAAADRYARAAELVQGLADGLVFNPREQLQLEALFLELPRPSLSGSAGPR